MSQNLCGDPGDKLAERHDFEKHLVPRALMAASGRLNLGTGENLSIRQILLAITRITGHEVPAVVRPHRPGDPPALSAAALAARKVPRFAPEHFDIDSIVRTAWTQFASARPSDPPLQSSHEQEISQ